MALLLGSAFAIEMCKPSVCAVMMATAAGLCQNLGFHRISTMKDDSEEDRNCKIHVFWMIYMFDKTVSGSRRIAVCIRLTLYLQMSLRLGRASVIQDFDISLPFFGGSKDALDSAQGKEMLAYWVKVARVQGQTYEKLFSPAAFLRPSADRTRTGEEFQVQTVCKTYTDIGSTSAAIELVGAMNIAWSERGDARLTDLSHVKTPGVQARGPPTANNSPNETQMPSVRKGRGQTPQATPLDADGYIKRRFGMSSDGSSYLQHQNRLSAWRTCSFMRM
jgi:hypothetical protein